MAYEETPYTRIESRSQKVGDYIEIEETMFGTACDGEGYVFACLVINGVTYTTTIEDMAEMIVMIADGLSEYHANKAAPK